MNAKPVVGDIVHLKIGLAKCMAAIVNFVHADDVVGLTVFYPFGAIHEDEGILYKVHQDETQNPDFQIAWHWPEKKVPIRSTPPDYEDYAVVQDKEGRLWIYSEPNDVWWYRQPSGEIAPHSVHSWQKLLTDYGPVIRSCI